MIEITVPAAEFWDSKKQEFITVKETTLVMEHSLISLSKWESKWHKPFLTKDPKTFDETIDYYRCMTISPTKIDPNIYRSMTRENHRMIDEYIATSQTATVVSSEKRQGTGRIHRETITSELIYYWMVSFNIPFECEKWPLSRLMTLIEICDKKNTPPKKKSKNEIMRSNFALNEARKKKLNTRG